VVETSGLENRRGESLRGFESHLLRNQQHPALRGVVIPLVCTAPFAPSAIILSMARTVFYEWQGEEYSFEQKGSDWYWAVGIIALAGVVASILFGNIILALVILAGAGTLALQAARSLRTHHFTVTNDGLTVDDHLYHFDEMLHFCVLEYIDPTWPPALSIKTKRLLAPHLLVPIEGPDPLELYHFFAERVEEGKHDESLFDKLVELFRL
jgi:hypothetical protein